MEENKFRDTVKVRRIKCTSAVRLESTEEHAFKLSAWFLYQLIGPVPCAHVTL
jgi:hypothetical protein